jgi:hypothetical protein
MNYSYRSKNDLFPRVKLIVRGYSYFVIIYDMWSQSRILRYANTMIGVGYRRKESDKHDKSE